MIKKYLPLVLAIAVLLAAVFLPLSPVVFKPFTTAEVLQLLSGILLIALVLERALEVFMTTWRAPGASLLEQDLRNRRDRIKMLEAEAEPGDQAAILQQERTELEGVREERAKYRSDTQGYALWSGLILGLVISLVGFRVLHQLITPESWRAMAAYPAQQYAFKAVDVLLTGGLIAGGSDGVHKLTQLYTAFMQASHEKAKGLD